MHFFLDTFDATTTNVGALPAPRGLHCTTGCASFREGDEIGGTGHSVCKIVVCDRGHDRLQSLPRVTYGVEVTQLVDQAVRLGKNNVARVKGGRNRCTDQT